MRSRSMFPKNLSTSGKPFINERTNTSFKGILVLTQGKPRIDFENSVDVKSTAWLVNSVGERLYVTELVLLSDSSLATCAIVLPCRKISLIMSFSFVAV